MSRRFATLAALALAFVVAPVWGAPGAVAATCSQQDAYHDPRAQAAVAAVAAADPDVADGEAAITSAATRNGTLTTPGYLNARITIVLQNGFLWNCGTGKFVDSASMHKAALPVPGGASGGGGALPAPPPPSHAVQTPSHPASAPGTAGPSAVGSGSNGYAAGGGAVDSSGAGAGGAAGGGAAGGGSGAPTAAVQAPGQVQPGTSAGVPVFAVLFVAVVCLGMMIILPRRSYAAVVKKIAAAAAGAQAGA
jgi:hypothetical protein